MGWRIIGTRLRNLFASLKRNARKSDQALRNSLRDTANHITTKAKDAKRKGGYK